MCETTVKKLDRKANNFILIQFLPWGNTNKEQHLPLNSISLGWKVLTKPPVLELKESSDNFFRDAGTNILNVCMEDRQVTWMGVASQDVVSNIF